MNASKGAAVLMLVGAFAAGIGTPIVYKSVVDSRPKPPECPQPRSQNSFFERYAKSIGLDTAQKQATRALLDERNRAVQELFAGPRVLADSINARAQAQIDSILKGPRAQADSIRKASLEKQNALLTPEQKARLLEREAAIKQREAERQAQRQADQARCERLQPRDQSAAPNGKQQQPKSKSNH